MCVEPTLLSAPVAMLTARLVGARTLLHIQDLEVDAAFVFGHIHGRLIRRAAGAVERLVLNCFGRVVTISAKMREALLAKGVRSEKVEVLRNWVDVEAITPQPAGAPNMFRDQLRIDNDQFVVLYAGHIGVKQALDVVLEAAASLMDSATIRFVIAGDGPVKARLQKNFGELTNVDFLPLQPAERLQELLAMANLHVLPQHKGVADLALPSKLGGMLASGRPILAMADPGAELFQILSGVAILTPPGEAVALASAIRAAASADLSQHVAEGLRLAEMLDAKRLLPLFELALLGDGKQLSAAAAVMDILAEVA
jgi:colanic acid biosynthesis glycosyl transferase WcaI